MTFSAEVLVEREYICRQWLNDSPTTNHVETISDLAHAAHCPRMGRTSRLAPALYPPQTAAARPARCWSQSPDCPAGAQGNLSVGDKQTTFAFPQDALPHLDCHWSALLSLSCTGACNTQMLLTTCVVFGRCLPLRDWRMLMLCIGRQHKQSMNGHHQHVQAHEGEEYAHRVPHGALAAGVVVEGEQVAGDEAGCGV